MNQQPIEKRVMRNDGQIDVHSVFYTIQGEGPFCGTPAVFIRVAGCNLQCPSCDTDYTSKRALAGPIELVERVQALIPRGLVVITGGEPFRQDLTTLLVRLLDNGYFVQIETNGSLGVPAGVVDLFNTLPDQRTGIYIVCSPKAGKIHPDILRWACCLKYVMASDGVANDGLPVEALYHPASPRVARPPANWARPIYLQPLDVGLVNENKRNRDACVTSCMKHGYILQLQVHKILGLE